MSIKVNVFRGMLGNPLNTHNFLVKIPRLQDVEVMVNATSFPTETLQQYVSNFQGEVVRFPSLPTNNGTWSCTIPEGEYAKIYNAITREHALNYQQDTGAMTNWAVDDFFDIEVIPRGLRAGLTLKDSDVPFKVIMRGCYLAGFGEVQLGAGQATQAWNWQLQFSYTYLEYIKATPLSFTHQLTPVSQPTLPELDPGANEVAKQNG